MKILALVLYIVTRKGYFYPVTNSNNMTTSDLALLKPLNLTDLIAIQDALQAQARATEKFLYECIAPNKVEYPSLFESYTKQFEEETNRFFKFKSIMVHMY